MWYDSASWPNRACTYARESLTYAMSKPILFHYLHSSACFYSFTYIFNIVFLYLGSGTVVQKYFIFSILFLQFYSFYMNVLFRLLEWSSKKLCSYCSKFSWVLRCSAHHKLCSCSELGQCLIATYHACNNLEVEIVGSLWCLRIICTRCFIWWFLYAFCTVGAELL